MREKVVEIVRDLSSQHRFQEAAVALEFLLILDAEDYKSRFALAKLYINLKENHFRAKARHHLETVLPYLNGESLEVALRLLVFNVYLSHGPISKVKKILEKYSNEFNQDELNFINEKLDGLNDCAKVKIRSIRQSVLPEQISYFNNFEDSVDNIIFNQFYETVSGLKKPSKFFTFGSCFAGNVALEMKKRRIDVESFCVGEEVNTTFSNVNLLNHILGNATSYAKYYDDLLNKSDINYLRKRLINSDAMIFTLGVAPAFFGRDGEFIPHSSSNLKSLIKESNATYRISTVQENVEKLIQLKSLLQEKTAINKIFLTVSPIPISDSLLSRSIAVDDAESKSILRVAAGEICRNYSEYFIYFPSFEVFRWLACFRDQSGFGLDDGVARHANSDMVEKVVSAFLNAFDTNSAHY